MINFNKNKIKMIKPFISFRDNLSFAGWSVWKETNANHSLLLLFHFPPRRKQTEETACGQIFEIN